MFIKIGDIVKHSMFGIGKVKKIEKKILFIEFEEKKEMSKFEINDFDRYLKKYFEEEDIYKEYDSLKKIWFNENGYDDDGFNKEGYNSKGINREGFDREGIHIKTNSIYNSDGFDVKGFNKEGFNKEGLHYIHINPFTIYKIIIKQINQIEERINEKNFFYSLIEVGKQTNDKILRNELLDLYYKLKENNNYWEETKKKIVDKIGWDSFSIYERTDIPPPNIPGKERKAICYKCKGHLYSEYHKKCIACNWLRCPYDSSCGCDYKGEIKYY